MWWFGLSRRKLVPHVQQRENYRDGGCSHSWLKAVTMPTTARGVALKSRGLRDKGMTNAPRSSLAGGSAFPATLPTTHSLVSALLSPPRAVSLSQANNKWSGAMVSSFFRAGILVVALATLASGASYAQMANSSEIGPDDNTSIPTVIVPSMTFAPQTPLSAAPPIGQQSFSGSQSTIGVHPMSGRSLSR
jgi:hypothetical protein